MIGRMLASICLAMALSMVLALGAAAPSPVRAETKTTVADQGPQLLWVEISVAGKPIRINAGGVLSLHPDAPFMPVKADTDAWLDLGLEFRLAGRPSASLDRFHTLSELLGQGIYDTDHLYLEVVKDGQVLGRVRLLVKLLPIDWLRRAEAAQKPADKIEALKHILELTPDDPLVRRRLLDLYIEAKRYGEAVQMLEGRDMTEDDPATLRKLADLYLLQGNKAKAAQALSKLLADDPENQEMLAQLARLYEDNQRWAEAALLWERLARLRQGQAKAETLLRLAEALHSANLDEQALAPLEEAAKLRPKDKALWLRLGRQRQAAGQPEAAALALERAVALAPDDADLLLEVSEAMLAAGRGGDAAEMLERAAKLRPKQNALWLRLAKLRESLDDRPGMARAYAGLAKAGEASPDVSYNLGVLLLEQGKPAEALEHLRKAAADRPDDQEVAALIFEALADTGQWDKAADQALAMLAKADAAGKQAVVEMARRRLMEQDPKGMAKLLDQALKDLPRAAKFYELRLALALDANDQTAAIKALEPTAKHLPQDLDLAYQLATLYEAAGRDADALQTYGRILDMDSGFKDAQERYMALKTSLLQRGGGDKQ